MYKHKCEICGQTAFAENRCEWNGKKLCVNCYNARFTWENVENLGVEIYTDYFGSDPQYDTTIIPLEDNLQEEGIDEVDFPDLLDAFAELKKRWESQDWGFYGRAEISLTNAPDIENRETVRCEEFWDVWIYRELAYEVEMYDRPFDTNPKHRAFMNRYAAECYIGNVYSKDFMYHTCDSCERLVCGQNPSNGWHSQVHIHDGWVECNKCYEERVLAEGMEEDYDYDTIPGQFFNYEDIEAAGWKQIKDNMLVGHGRFEGYANPQRVHEVIQGLIKNGKKFLVNYESMGIGGGGGYVSIYEKPKEVIHA